MKPGFPKGSHKIKLKKFRNQKRGGYVAIIQDGVHEGKGIRVNTLPPYLR